MPSEMEASGIEFRADDMLIKRAENIWLALGFANDRFGAIAKLAGFLAVYRELDERAISNDR